MLAPCARERDREAWLSATIQTPVAAAEPPPEVVLPLRELLPEKTPPQRFEPKGVSAPGSELCERYADAAGRIVNGWYRTELDCHGVDSLIGTFINMPNPLSAYVSKKERPCPSPRPTVEWACTPRELSLRIGLPAHDDVEGSSVVLQDIVASLPSLGLDPAADEMKIAVTLQTGDSASFEPAIRE